jgi:leucyl aminopeptidase
VTGAAPCPRIVLLPELPALGTDDLLAVPVGAGGTLPAWLTGPQPPVSPELLAGALADTGNDGGAAKVTNVPIAGRRPRSVVAVGVGTGTVPELRRYVATCVRRAQTLAEHGATRLVLPVDGAAPAGYDEVRAAVEAALLAGYRFRDSSARPPRRLGTVAVVAASTGPDVAGAVVAGEVTAGAVAWARDLVNTGPHVGDPAWLAGRATDRLAALPHVTVTVLGPDELRAGGFGGVLAVGGGSASPPCVVVASYRPPSAGPAHPVLIGKGITFDTGGLSIRTTAGMRHMHTDMAGGAAVLATVDAAARLRLPVAVTAVVPAAENAVSGSSYRPADVVRHVGGRTTEVRRTDAEGHLVLADALAHARLELGATALVDVATLTGAMTQALGSRTGGLYATSDGLARALGTAAAAAGEPLWRLPLAQEYRALLDSPVADANNAPGNPGGTTAALFLEPFAGGLPWAHLDIAGPARSGSDHADTVKGGTGFGTRTLLRWLEAGAPGEAGPMRSER